MRRNDSRRSHCPQARTDRRGRGSTLVGRPIGPAQANHSIAELPLAHAYGAPICHPPTIAYGWMELPLGRKDPWLQN